MDYSTADETGASPWATSPQQSRFTPSNQPDVPPSPLPPSAQYGDESRPNTADSEAVERFPGKAPLSPPAAENGDSRQQQLGHESPQDHYAGGPATQARNAGQRHKGAPKERREKPQYKLTAKVTGLERNGRKDPVLRFDVYVRVPRDHHCYTSRLR